MNQPESVWLEGLAGPYRGQRMQLSHDTLLGRSRVCDIHIAGAQISRQHARIRYAQGQYYLQNQDSALGTQVNGRMVQATALQDGDTITIGECTFRFRRQQQAAVSVPPGGDQQEPHRPESGVGAPQVREAPLRQVDSPVKSGPSLKGMLPVVIAAGLIVVLALAALFTGTGIGDGGGRPTSPGAADSPAPDVDPWEVAVEESRQMLSQHPDFEAHLAAYQDTAEQVDEYLAFEQEAEEIVATIDDLKAAQIPLVGSAWDLLVDTADATHPGAGQALKGLDTVLRELLAFKGSLDSLAALQATRTASQTFRQSPSEPSLKALDQTLDDSIVALEGMMATIDRLEAEARAYLDVAETTLEAIDQISAQLNTGLATEMSAALQGVIQPVRDLEAYVTDLRQSMRSDKELMEAIAAQAATARQEE